MKNNLFIYIVILISFTTFSCEDEKDTTGPELSIVSPKNKTVLYKKVSKKIATLKVSKNNVFSFGIFLELA